MGGNLITIAAEISWMRKLTLPESLITYYN